MPLPGKSYKDLTPKDIELIYTNYRDIRHEMRDEPDNYAKHKKILLVTKKILEVISKKKIFSKIKTNLLNKYLID